MSGSTEPTGTSTARPAWRRIDDAIFAIERALVATALVLITVTSFADVVARRLEAPDSKVGEILARLLRVTDSATRLTLDHTVAPIVSWVTGYLLIVFAVRGAEQQRGRPFAAIAGSAWLVSLAVLALFFGIGELMVRLPSSTFTLGSSLAALALVVGYTARRREPGWQLRVAGLVGIALPLVTWFSLHHVPVGYAWGKEVSLVLVLWVGLFGASICVHEGKHIRLEALEKTHPRALLRGIAVVGFAVAAAFSFFLTYLAIDVVRATVVMRAYLAQTALPDWLMVVVIPVAFGLAGLRFAIAALDHALGGDYGAAAKAEGMEDAEKLAKERGVESSGGAAGAKSPVAFIVVIVIAAALALFGGAGGLLAAVIVGAALLALPLFVVLGLTVVACMMLWLPAENLDFHPLIEQIRGLTDSDVILAIPLFILSGAVMARGAIGQRLIQFANALLGWLPGGLAMGSVFACMIFAAISGSSPATVVAIGGIAAPAMIRAGYRESFAHGLVTSAGSLGILIPPSIPMLVYAIVNQTSPIRVEDLFASGYGPGLVIGGLLMAYSFARGVVDRTPRTPFSWTELRRATLDGFWSLLFPLFILVGTNSGIFTAVEAAAASVVYAVVVEVFLHRALSLETIPAVFQEVGVMLGSFLVILIIAKGFGEFLVQADVPAQAGDFIRARHYTTAEFLLAMNLMLLVVGMLMDIMSAIFVFVPLIAPMAAALGIDPLHLGIIFIVNLEIGYLTPPVGLNLFVATTLFGKSLGYIVRAVVPFILAMTVGLVVITYYPPISGDLGRAITGSAPWTPPPTATSHEELDDVEVEDAPARPATAPACANGVEGDRDCDGVLSMEEMMELGDAQEGATGDTAGEVVEDANEAPPTPPRCANGVEGDRDCDGVLSMEEMMELSERAP